jgi:hypothetical protein
MSPPNTKPQQKTLSRRHRTIFLLRFRGRPGSHLPLPPSWDTLQAPSINVYMRSLLQYLGTEAIGLHVLPFRLGDSERKKERKEEGGREGSTPLREDGQRRKPSCWPPGNMFDKRSHVSTSPNFQFSKKESIARSLQEVCRLYAAASG